MCNTTHKLFYGTGDKYHILPDIGGNDRCIKYNHGQLIIGNEDRL